MSKWRKRKRLGAVLIEVAFSIPLFLILTYYIHDLPRLKLMQRKTQFVANETAAILQSIARIKRTSDSPMLIKQDFGKAVAFASLSLFPGNTVVPKEYKKFIFGYYPHFIFHYIEGTGANTATRKWILSVFFDGEKGKTATTNVLSDDSILNGLTHTNLSVLNDETKIVVEFGLLYDLKKSGSSSVEIPPKDAFGFLFFRPKGKGSNERAYFPAISAFNPINSGFSETIPADQ